MVVAENVHRCSNQGSILGVAINPQYDIVEDRQTPQIFRSMGSVGPRLGSYLLLPYLVGAGSKYGPGIEGFQIHFPY